MCLVVVSGEWRVANGVFLPATRYLPLATFISGEKLKTLTILDLRITNYVSQCHPLAIPVNHNILYKDLPINV
ncbi:MAG: hypothetical protein FOGNACKC_03568 [Anaerolineae bacterium]|nr:hypothetical protein [Anaerolineae bacterium]